MLFYSLLRQLWGDDFGGIVTSEYMMLLGVVTLGVAPGLATLRDSGNKDMQEMSNLIYQTRQQLTPGFVAPTNSQSGAPVSPAAVGTDTAAAIRPGTAVCP